MLVCFIILTLLHFALSCLLSQLGFCFLSIFDFFHSFGRLFLFLLTLNALRTDHSIPFHIGVLNNVLDSLLVAAFWHAELHCEVSAFVLGAIHLSDGLIRFIALLKLHKGKASVHVRRWVHRNSHFADASKLAKSCLQVLLPQVEA